MCIRDSLDANESATLKIVVQVIRVGNITNNVNVTGTCLLYTSRCV